MLFGYPFVLSAVTVSDSWFLCDLAEVTHAQKEAQEQKRRSGPPRSGFVTTGMPGYSPYTQPSPDTVRTQGTGSSDKVRFIVTVDDNLILNC